MPTTRPPANQPAAQPAAPTSGRRLPRAERREQLLAAATRAFARAGFAATSLDDRQVLGAPTDRRGSEFDAEDHGSGSAGRLVGRGDSERCSGRCGWQSAGGAADSRPDTAAPVAVGHRDDPNLGRARLVSQPGLAGRPLLRGPAKPRLLGPTPAPDLHQREIQSPAAGVLEFALGLCAKPPQLLGVHQ